MCLYCSLSNHTLNIKWLLRRKINRSVYNWPSALSLNSSFKMGRENAGKKRRRKRGERDEEREEEDEEE